MAVIEPAPMQANKNIGTITLVKLLTPKELDGKCDMFAKVIIPPLCGIDVHKHEGNTETYHILSGQALYTDNGEESAIEAGTTTFCADGDTHGIRNISKTEDLVFMALIIRK